MLGSFPIAAAVLGEREQAILKIEKTPLNLDVLNEGVLGDVRIIQTTDIVRRVAPLNREIFLIRLF